MVVLGAAAGTVVGVVVVWLALLTVGMRWKVGTALDVVRRFNKTVANPRVLRTAGSTESRTSLIRHVGRNSGGTYDTPVDAIATADGFVIAMPYGTRADWVRNVLAAGGGIVVTDGHRVDVDRPSIVATADVADLIPRRTMLTLRLFGVDQCLRLEKASAST